MVEQINVLVVAHGKRSLDEFQACLEGMGYRSRAASDSQNALILQSKMPADVIMVGFGTADVDGLDHLFTLRRQNPDTPLVVVTDPANLHKVIEGVRLGVWDYLVEPMRDEGELDLVIRRVLERTRLTESKRTSESALRFNEELERRVHERTIQLESANDEITTLNDDLLRRSQELEKANLQLESFSYSISHDLRTPLRHVHALSRMLRELAFETLDGNGRRYLELIESGCQRMECLVNDLLNFRKLSLQPLIKTTVQTKDLASDVMAELTSETPERHVEVTIGDLPACQADIPLLRQVFRNLLGNALKYSRKRELPRIQVGSMVRNDQTVYFVRDNGAGFNMEFAGKLFGVFQRLQHATEYEGTGVGLAIAQNIIQRHGGKIWAESTEDNGATFYFTLARERF